MKKIALASALMLSAFLMTACQQNSSGASGNAASETTTQNTGAVSSANGQTSQITVTSSEKISLKPDMAQISFGLDTEKASIEEATTVHQEKIDAIVDYLKGIGFDESSISTSDISLYTTYNYDYEPARITGYRMYANIKLKDVKEPDTGNVIKGVLEHGVNRVDGISYYSSAYDETYKEALDKALASSKEKAESIAASTGNTIGNILSITEGYPDYSTRYSATSGYMDYGSAPGNMMKAESSGMGSITVLPSQLEITATVTATYEMK